MVIEKKTSNRFIWAVAILALVGLFFVVRSATRAKLPIRIAQVQQGSLIKTLSTNGRVEPQVNFEAHALSPGTVRAVYAHEGDLVARGKLLLVLDDTDARAHLATAVAAVRAAQAGYDAISRGGTQEERLSLSGELTRAEAEREQANRDVVTIQKLVGTGAAAPSELNAAKERLALADTNIKLLQQRQTSRYAPIDMSHARAELADAQAAQAAAQTVVSAANVRAPFAGTVYSLPVSPTEFVQQGDKLLQMADLSHVQVRAYFDEPEIGTLQNGQPIKIQWAAKPDLTWHGHIIRIPSTIIGYGTRNVGEVLVQVDDANGALLPNTNVTVTVTVNSVARALTVPREALHTDAGKDYVYTVGRDKLKRQNVQVGAINLTQVQVLSGLQEGETVALGTTNGQPLTDGVPIRIVE
ncbi:MAG TPA: efflux RND transporter periplasmic adaptor subunit [Acidisarcina sp.]